MEPFFNVLVSPDDGWGFISSTGAITAGRHNADLSLFPYRPEDQLLDALSSNGSHTMVRALRPTGSASVDTEQPILWVPFDQVPRHGIERALELSSLSDEVILEERHLQLGLIIRIGWRWSTRYGLVRSTTITYTGPPEVARDQTPADHTVGIDLDDGVINVLPPGTTQRAVHELSPLLDAYKVVELDPDSGLAWVRLNAALTDLAEPAESLQATAMWSVTPTGLAIDVRPPSRRHRREVSDGTDVSYPLGTRGHRAAYRVRGTVRLSPGESSSWQIVMNPGLDAAAIATLQSALRLAGGQQIEDSPAAWLNSDLRRTRERLSRMIAAADGFQHTAQAQVMAHHTMSVLFNVMRGGVPADGLATTRGEILAFVRSRYHRLPDTWAEVLDDLPAQLTLTELDDVAQRVTDPDLRRLLLSHLPLTFSRRHGDPSRPWNRFEIGDGSGEPSRRYEGNWRDLLQNWEALAISYPTLLDRMIRLTLDAMTPDGHNPYRLATEGADWEVPDPDDPWANIGYWGDHQVTYLHQLLRRRRDLLGRWDEPTVTRQDRVYTDVPYRLAPFRTLRDGTGDMVTLDADRDVQLRRDRAEFGGDAVLRCDEQGRPLRATMLEKLFLIAATKMLNLVPGAGIWMNTQRPEWNDANNALVGRGVSMVTAAQLRAYVADLVILIDDLTEYTIPVSEPLARLSDDLAIAFSSQGAETTTSPRARWAVMTELGAAADRFRQAVAGPALAHRSALSRPRLRELLVAFLDQLDVVLRQSRGPDGLATSYSMLTWGQETVEITGLGPMLEGQVALLASGTLDADAATALLTAVREGPLWSPAQGSFLLYPDRDVSGLLERAAVPRSAYGLRLFDLLAADRDRRLVSASADGRLFFGSRLRNRRDVTRILQELSDNPRLQPIVALEHDAVLDAFEQAVNHASFTGRSGSFFAYEGLGSVYWHMVSKYLAVALETRDRCAQDANVATIRRLDDEISWIRKGLGHHRPAADFGAVPSVPHSHSPLGGGARQPGMTGQAKEDVLIRWRDLGLDATDGQVSLLTHRVDRQEFVNRGTEWIAQSSQGPVSVSLPPNSLAFTWCQTPVVYRQDGEPRLVIIDRDGERHVEGHEVPTDVAHSIMRRDGRIEMVVAYGA